MPFLAAARDGARRSSLKEMAMAQKHGNGQGSFVFLF